MQITYHEDDDILFIKLNDAPIVRDVSHGWNVNLGYTAEGVGEITILDARKAGMLPIHLDPATAAQVDHAAA